ncbi:NAD(P)H-dependent oxidoreductase [Streptomyces sp. NPDC049954]|uniref:flavodoxin family protein n=1 Tax=Streptomyces sp. NPDC049954 TaxID=3155779 RepID=UPI00343CF7E5
MPEQPADLAASGTPTPPAPSFLFLLAGAREDGNTEALARAAAQYLPPWAEQRWIHLGDLALPDFRDLRHSPAGPAPAPASEAEAELLRATLSATDLVVASPLYWYSLSAQAKRYLDYWSAWLRLPGLGFRSRMAGRTLWGVSAMADEDARRAAPLIDTLRLSAEYMEMRFGGVLLGNGSRPGDIHTDDEALARAKDFFGDAAV